MRSWQSLLVCEFGVMIFSVHRCHTAARHSGGGGAASVRATMARRLDVWSRFHRAIAPGALFVLIGFACSLAASADAAAPGSVMPLHTVPPTKKCQTEAALAALYDGLLGTLWKNNSGWRQRSWAPGQPQVPVCHWFGIVCDDHSQVIGVYLAHNGLGGQLTPDMLCFGPSVTELDLSGNAISGPLPQTIPQKAMALVEAVNFAGNELSGALPEWCVVVQRSFGCSTCTGRC